MGKLTRWHQSSSLNPCSQAPLTPCSVNNDVTQLCMAEISYRTVHACHEVLAWLRAMFCSPPVRTSPSKPWLLPHQSTLEWHRGYVIWGYVMAIYVVAAATDAASARREAVLWLPCQLGENIHVCSSYGPSSLLPTSYLKPCLSWIQQIVWTVWTTIHLV